MFRIILIIFCFLLSLFTIMPVPSHYVWYLGIMASEFPWVFLGVLIVLLAGSIMAKRYRVPGIIISLIAFILFLFPIIGAYRIAGNLDQRIASGFSVNDLPSTGFQQDKPYTFGRMISGIGAGHIPYTTYTYATHTGVALTLDFFKAPQPAVRPCVVVVHGGSWKSGNSHELPDVTSRMAREGYNVASINYRLAPAYKSPAPVEDVRAALTYLRAHAAELNVDTNNFVLLGRSAGGQIVLASAYTLNDPGIKGVISFYGPTDMAWAYNHPDNPLIMDSKKVMSDFFGGTLSELPQNYKAGSATAFVTALTVPTLLVHGGNDAHVHYEESEILDKKLEQYHVKHLLLGLPWATHGCEYSLNGPSGQLSSYAVERFLYIVTHK
ncbi:MAG: alpha/beta hydrolase fold domain-containing protein [Taibaiella sp.]|nr:alpha/beta hydrolase fold domain-containing protein [Taibaiella sp.]